MALDPKSCPPELDEVAEDYVMGLLSSADVVAFEYHLRTCSRCVKAVEDAHEYVRAMRLASRRLRKSS